MKRNSINPQARLRVRVEKYQKKWYVYVNIHEHAMYMCMYACVWT